MIKFGENVDEEIPQLDIPESPKIEEQESEERPTLESIKSNYVAYVTASAFAALSTLFGILYFTQKSSYDTARSDLAEEKREAVIQRKSDSATIEKLRNELRECDNNSLEDLERKLEIAQRLKIVASSDYKKLDREITIAKENADELVNATKNVKKALTKN